MFGGSSLQELGFIALLVGIILLAPITPRIGEAIGGLFEKSTEKDRDRA
jgi:hypothetical protein